jgi:hypothetical protein
MNSPHWVACAASSDWRKLADFSGNADYSEYRMGKERESKEKASADHEKHSVSSPHQVPPAPIM